MMTNDKKVNAPALYESGSIPKEKFKFVQLESDIHDERFKTKAIGYFGDAWIRFRKDKSAVVAFCLIVFLLLYALIVPLFSSYNLDFRDDYYRDITPRAGIFENSGFWDGGKDMNQNEAGYLYLKAIGMENNKPVIMKVYKEYTDSQGEKRYDLRYDTYRKVGFVYMNLNADEYEALQNYQDETGIQVIYPLAKTHITNGYNYVLGNNGANFWYKLENEGGDTTGAPLLDENGDYIPNYLTSNDPNNADYHSLRIAGDGETGEDGKTVWYTYAAKQGRVGNYYKVRVDYEEYFIYQNHFKPSFLFGTNVYGQDIFTCLAIAARFSLLLAISVALINFMIGVVYGSTAGYYGGWQDMLLERISDVLASVPFMVVATLFQLHLAEKVGPVVSLLFAFVLVGWVGTAARVRTQFYRFKGQEYVLAARTLGASDRRLIFKHIFPNSLGTIITGSVMTIPGVIFSESMLSYLKIINLETNRTITSVGTMLSQGQKQLSTTPHEILFPALFIAILEISFNLFGNGLRDALNPSLRGVEN